MLRPVRPLVRPAFWALPAAVLLTLLLRSLAHGMGADELSLLVMAQAMRDGALPYETYWDVRAPLAYLWALPTAFTPDATHAVAALRISAWLAQVMAVWAFFCLFRRSLGKVPAALGAWTLAASANLTALHDMAVPNHFSMAMSVLAFACVVAGRRGRGAAYLLGGLIAGALPWVMVHAAPVSASLAALAVFWPGGGTTRRQRVCWMVAAALPTLAVVGAFFLWGPFDVFLRTTLGAPLGVFEMRGTGGYRGSFADVDVWRIAATSPGFTLTGLVAVAGLLSLPAALRAAPPPSALRHAAFLVAPLALGFTAMAHAKPPAPPEYWIDMAPVMALLVAVAAARGLAWRGWAGGARRVWMMRHGAAACLAAVLALQADPWRKPPRPLPASYCLEAVPHWLSQLRPGETVLDVMGLCNFQLFDAGAKLQPPFTFPPLWMRQFTQPWIGAALDGDGSKAAAAARLRAALAPNSTVGLLLADDEFLREVQAQGWEQDLRRHWRQVWFQRVAGIEAGERFARMAIFKRRHS